MTHPIQGLMQTAMENIRDMVDVNTIVGDPVECPDGSVIVPVSRVGFGFAAGGSEWGRAFGQGDSPAPAPAMDQANAKAELPFGGGSGGGVSITPIAFLVVNHGDVKVVPLDNQTHILERLIESVPVIVERLQSLFRGTFGGRSHDSVPPADGEPDPIV